MTTNAGCEVLRTPGSGCARSGPSECLTPGVVRSPELIPTERVSQIGTAYPRIVDDLLWRAFHEDSAVVDDQGSVADFEGLGDVVIRDEHALAEFFLEAADLALEV